MSYTVQAHLKPKALAGISGDQIDQHREQRYKDSKAGRFTARFRGGTR
jgi:hypothetical protein